MQASFQESSIRILFEESSRQLRQRERMTAASEHEPILRRVHNLPTCQIERTPAAHRPASVQVPSSSLQLSLDIPWHANTRCVNHAPDQKLKSRSLLALDVIRRLTTTVDRGTSFDLQAEVIWRRPLRRSFTRPSARALGVGEPPLISLRGVRLLG